MTDKKQYRLEHPITLASDAYETKGECKGDGWIKVEESLPGFDYDVLVAVAPAGIVFLGNYDNKAKKWHIDRGQRGTVTHWRQLPEPPIMDLP